MPDYQKGKIYTIRCHDDDNLIYVGSTIQPLSVRWGGHKRDCKKDNPEISIDKLMKQNGIDLYYIELFENFPCNSKEQLRKKEGEVQRQIATVNKNIAGRTLQEYYIDNKQKIAERHKKYNQNHKEKIAEKKKKYRANQNKEEVAKYQKNYYNDNKEKIAEKNNIYYQNHKEEIAVKSAAKITCDRCGIVIRRDSLRRHHKSKKCEELSKNKICPIINDA
tara:strand:+ start:426 stop:1085 length:660 start_codon:yes stop_codon:yes gene_type:complete